jgi:formylglycine-generating enzyme required for sulfatase activity
MSNAITVSGRRAALFLLLPALAVCSVLTRGEDGPGAAGTVRIDLGGGVSFALVRIEPGRFNIGSPEHEKGRRENENSQPVSITRAFYLGEYEVTQALWDRVMTADIAPALAKTNESGCYWEFGGAADAFLCPAVRTVDPNQPVQSVSWRRCKEFLARLNLLVDKGGFRLPTEAEWEYAARAGTSSAYFFGDDAALLRDYAWYADSRGGVCHRVGRLRPNPLGLYDIYGNVWEWCEDEFVGAYPFRDGPPPADYCNLGSAGGNTYQTIRGGSFAFSGRFCRSASRSGFDAWQYATDIGIRLARTVEAE